MGFGCQACQQEGLWHPWWLKDMSRLAEVNWFCLVCAFNQYTFACIPWSGDTCFILIVVVSLESQYDTTWWHSYVNKNSWTFSVCFADTVLSTPRSANRQAHIPTGRLIDGALHLEFDVSGSSGFNRILHDLISLGSSIHSSEMFFSVWKNSTNTWVKSSFYFGSKELPDCHDCVCLVQAFEMGWWWECNAGWMRWPLIQNDSVSM